MQALSNAQLDQRIIEECLEDNVGEIWERNVRRMRAEQEQRQGEIHKLMERFTAPSRASQDAESE